MSNKFKVGDKVVRLAGGNNSSGLHIGETYQVDRVKGIDIGVVGTPYLHSTMYFELALPQYPNPPHKHAELIIAWAQGATIQVYDALHGWYDRKQPSWFFDDSYRIKPTKSKETLQREEEIAKIKSAMEVQQKALTEQQEALDKLEEIK